MEKTSERSSFCFGSSVDALGLGDALGGVLDGNAFLWGGVVVQFKTMLEV